MDEADSLVALFSLGAFLHHDPKDNTKITIDIDGRAYNVGIIAGLLVAMLILTIGFLIYMRYRLKEFENKLDEDAMTPSDFCVMGTNMYFDKYNPEAMETEIREGLKIKFGIEDIQYINPAYYINDFYKLVE